MRARRPRRLYAALLGAAICLAATEASALPKLEGEPDKKLGRPGEPGSGVPIEEQLKTVNRDALTAPLPMRPRDDAEAEAVGAIEELSARYKSAHDAAAHTIGQQLLLGGVQGRKALELQYEREIREHQAKARKLRAQAVRRYEDFLAQHPNDPAWTPEVMFRLAELQFEASSERLARQEDAWEKEVEAYQKALENNPDAQPPPSPKPDYGEAIALYRGIVQRFPRFHLGDGSLYMMGTLLYEMEELDQSRQSYLALACSNKHEAPLADGSNVVTPVFNKGDYEDCTPFKADSVYAAEAWLRIGEVHYDFDELAPALEAYAQAASDPQGDLYDEALIRMAWTLYLMREFPEAARRFDEFIRYADANRDVEGESGAIALRDEAVKYLAKTYFEQWDGDTLQPLSRLDRDYAERGKERHVPEVYAALGDLKAFETDFQAAISIWDKTLARWPLAPAAPSIQNRILEAREMLQDKDGATRARDMLATNYLRGTEWFYANEDDPDAIEEAMKLAEGALVATATDHHEKAQILRGEGDDEGARLEYAIAAKAYAAYLERFPDTDASYEYRFNYAESLYYSLDYVEAAKQYAEVRDSNIDNRLQEDAASGAVLALEAYVDKATRDGSLDRPPMPKEGVEGPFDEPKEIPPVFVALRTAYDRFVQVRPDSKQAASMMYLAGEVSQRFHHFEDAEQRFSDVLDAHCEDNASIRSGLAIVDGKVAQQDLKGAQEWTEKLSGMGCGSGEEAAKFAGTLKTLGNAVRFKEATILYEAEEFEAAADRYVALVDQAPNDPNADRALNNAAVAYENIGRFSSASQTYKRIYSDYPDSEFADDALQRSGLNHSRFFEYEEAVSSYLVLAEDERYKDSELRENALWNAAGLLDSLQEYKRSAAMYQRFAQKTEDEAKGADALFRAANVLGKTSDHKATIGAYEQFLGKFGTDNKYGDKAVESYLRIGQAWQSLDKRSKAEEYYRRTVEEFNRRGLKPSSEAADHPSEAQFLLAEFALNDVLAIKITGSGKKMERDAKMLTDRLVLASKEYDNVFPFRRIDWVLAAMYRRGYAFETYAISLRAAPVPKKLKEYSEAWFAYTDIVGKIAEQFETKAIGLYEETVKRAREYNMANEWTRAAVERLNIYKPQEYPLLRQPALDLQLEAGQ